MIASACNVVTGRSHIRFQEPGPARAARSLSMKSGLQRTFKQNYTKAECRGLTFIFDVSLPRYVMEDTLTEKRTDCKNKSTKKYSYQRPATDNSVCV